MKNPLLISMLIACLTTSLHAEADMKADELEQWFNEDAATTPAQVDENEIEFLPVPPEKPVLHTINNLIINQNSIDNGWVKLSQCYKHLDPVGKTDVVYRYKFLRALDIISKRHIGKATVKGQSIALEDVGNNAELCVKAEVRIFYQNPNGTFSLINGPYHRKYLDGYFPYHVTLSIQYPESKLMLINTIPREQPGFELDKKKNKLTIDTHFAGTLMTEIIFNVR